jgi:putative transposase
VGRQPREFVLGGMYHIYSRGSNRHSIFTFDSDRIDFLECLDRVVRRYELTCLSYCLMPNHYHLVVETPDGRLSNAMKALNGRYALRFNRRHGRDAHLFKNRFGAVLQETESQLLQTIRYVARNPIDAGLCAQPDEWPWSSYGASAGLTKAPAFLSVHPVHSLFVGEADRAMALYRELVSSPAEGNGV